MFADIRSYSQMLEFLSEGIGTDNKKIEVTTFDANSPKTLEDLYTELVENQVKLGYLEPDNHVVRTAFSARVLIQVPSAGVQYRETHRIYMRTGRIVGGKPRAWTFSGTLHRAESWVQCAQRELIEEAGKRVPLEVLEEGMRPPNGKDEFSLRKSDAYRCLMSATEMRLFVVQQPKLLWPQQSKVVPDHKNHNTLMRIQRFGMAA